MVRRSLTMELILGIARRQMRRRRRSAYRPARRAVHARQHDCKFFAAIAGDQVAAAAEGFIQRQRDPAQHLVAMRVPDRCR